MSETCAENSVLASKSEAFSVCPDFEAEYCFGRPDPVIQPGIGGQEPGTEAKPDTWKPGTATTPGSWEPGVVT